MKKTILIVDDNQTDRKILTNLLEEQYHILTADSAKAMFAILQKSAESVAAVLLDLVMPMMDGFEALCLLRQEERYKQLPVIVTTGLTDEKNQVKALSYGANGYVYKPYHQKLILYTVQNAIALREKSSLLQQMYRDTLTGLYNREAFFEEAGKMLQQQASGYYLLSSLDVENFKVVNDQFGIQTGDAVLKYMADALKQCAGVVNGICCRYSADKFGMLYPADAKDSAAVHKLHEMLATSKLTKRVIRVRIGRYLVDDLQVPVSSMYDRATMAEESIRGRYDVFIAEYTASMRLNLLNEQKIVNDMDKALAQGEFEPWYQPQYNHATKALIGAEALVRWKRKDSFVQPAKFIPVFERNGFIYEMDQYIWEAVCKDLRRWLDEGYCPLPVSINISRRDLFHKDFLSTLTGLLKTYDIPHHLLRLEVTESAFAESSGQIIAKVSELIELGFVVEIDDFGSGYSSLNTLKDVAASILKLDMKFFENTKNSQRSGNIVESVVRMAKWLGMAVIAEGVEDKEQADYLKSIGCYYIQGYYYAKPMAKEEYEKLMRQSVKEPNLTRLETLKTLDNNEFWNPKSMETLIFNSYVGGACIFEYYNGKSELLRVNEQYTKELGGLIDEGVQLKDSSLVRFLDQKNKEKLIACIQSAINNGKQAFCEVCLREKEHVEYLRVTLRLIARAASRYLFYGVIVNVSEQRKAEQKRREAEEKQLESARQLEVIMNNVNGGVSAIQIHENGKSTFIFNNERYYELYGYTKEQAMNAQLDVMDTVVREDFELLMEKVRKLKQDRISTIIDYRIIKQDGHLAYLRANASLMYMEGYGDVIISVVTDITKQRELEEQLRAVIDNINGGVTATIIRNKKPEFIVANNRFFQMLGYLNKEEYEAEVQDVYMAIHPSDRARVVAQYESADGGKKQYTMEYRIIRKDGALRYIRNNISVIHLFGIDEPVQLSVANDVTEEYEAKQKEHMTSVQMQAIMANIHGGVTATVYHGFDDVEIVFSNDGFYEMYGFTKEQLEEEVGSPLNLIVEEDRKQTMETVDRIITKRGSGTFEYRCHKRDGSIIWVQCSNTVISLDGIGDTVLLAVITDITALREAQQKENDAADKLSAVLNNAGNGITAIALYPDAPVFLLANDRFYEIIGCTKEAYQKITAEDLFAYVYAEDRDRIRTFVTRNNQKKGSYTIEFRVARENSRLIWLKSVVTITNLSTVNVPVQIAIFSDITAEKESNDQLRFLNDAAHDILAQPDSELAIHHTLNNMMDYFKGDRSYVIELNYEKQVSNNTYEVCADGVDSELALLQNVPFSVSAYWIDALSKDEYVVIDDVRALEDSKKELRQLLLQQNIHSIIVAPLWCDGVLVGYVGVDNPTTAIHQLERLKALGDYIAILLTRRDLSAKIDSDQKMMVSLMDDIPGGFVRMKLSADKKFVPIYANRGFAQLVGMDQKQLHKIYGQDVLLGVHPEDRDIVRSAGVRMLQDGQAESARFRVQNGQKEDIWLTLYGNTSKDNFGNTYLNVYYSDASKQMEEEKKQKELLDNLPCGAALYEYRDKQMTVIHINKRYWELVERAPVDYRKVSVFEVIHPEDRVIVYQEIESAIRQKRDVEVDLRILCKENDYRPFHVVAHIVSEKNNRYLLFVSYTILSEQEMSIQEMIPVALSTMMSASGDLSYVKDRDLHYICCSKSMLNLLGLHDTTEVIGKTDYELFPQDYANSIVTRDKKIIEQKQSLIDHTERLYDKNGSLLLVNTSKYPIMDAKQNVIGLYGISRDITAQREKESQLELLTSSIPGGLAAYSISESGLRMLYFNDGFYQFSGCTREEYAVRVEADPLAFVFEEDKPLLRKMIDGFCNHKSDGHVNGCVYRCHTKEGGYRWMSMKSVLSQMNENEFVVNIVQLDITEQQEEKERLRISEELNRLAIEHSGNIITRFDVAKRTLTLPDSFNPIFVLPHVLTGMPEEQIKLKRISEDTADVYRDLFESIIAGKQAGSATYKQNSTKGWRWLDAQFTTVFDHANRPVSAVISFSDVTEKLEKEVVYNKWQQSLDERPLDSYTLFRCNLSKGTSYDSWEGKLLQVTFSDKTATFDDRTAEYVEQCVYPDDRKAYLKFLDSNKLLAEYYRNHRSNILEYRESLKNGAVRWLKLTVDLVEYPSSKDVEVYLMFENIDEQKKADLLTLERSQTDPLTGILNRSAFIMKMEELIHSSALHEKHALLMLDVDNFKHVNDTYGHGAGDQVLRNLTQQIRSILRHDDLIGRMGGDEFFVFLKDLPDQSVAAAKAEMICALQIVAEHTDVVVTASIGIAMIPQDGTDFDTLYKKVDAALYEQKQHGKNGYLFVHEHAEAHR